LFGFRNKGLQARDCVAALVKEEREPLPQNEHYPAMPLDCIAM